MNSEMSRRGFLAAAAALPVAAQAASVAGHAAPLKKGALGKYVGELPPGRYDSHIHVMGGKPDPEALVSSLNEAKLAGACIFSQAPYKRNRAQADPVPPEQAMDECIAWASASPTIYPFYYINPAKPDAVDLVDRAVE